MGVIWLGLANDAVNQLKIDPITRVVPMAIA